MMNTVGRVIVAGAMMALGGAGALYSACGPRNEFPGPKTPNAGSHPHPAFSNPDVASSGTLATADRSPKPHPRILLTDERIARLSDLRAKGAKSWDELMTDCDSASNEKWKSGYEAWDWAHAALELSLCFRVTKKPAYADAAVMYFEAMLDDKELVGDKKGGDKAVEHDLGYPIRTRGALAAIAYDWLSGFPKMTPDVKKKAVDRFVTWSKWFAQKGYNHDHPISNYYIGYFSTIALAGIAAEGEDPRAEDLRKTTSQMFNRELVPVYNSKLLGGDFTEGWQYGDAVLAFLAIYANAEMHGHMSAPPKPVYDELRWLKDVLAYQTHALLPDGVHVHEMGDWQEKPPKLRRHGMYALSLLFPKGDENGQKAAFFGQLARKNVDEKEEWRWLQALADTSEHAPLDPRKGPTTYFSQGSGNVFGRTDWTSGAVFSAIACAPSLSDHQHLDAGHFAIVRGGDQLAIDSGAYGSYSSMSHNTILIDDGRESSPYAPNQGTWSDTAHIERQEESGPITYAMADYVSAYNPNGYPENHPNRAAERAEREYIFSRTPVAGAAQSARVVVYDRITLWKPRYETTFVFHGGTPPQVRANVAKVTAGSSSLTLTTLLPANATSRLLNEPTVKTDRPFFMNDPAEGLKATRLEVPAPKGATKERRFLHVMAIGPAQMNAPTPDRISGTGAEGAALGEEAYVFVSEGPQKDAAAVSYAAPTGAREHYVVGLARKGTYKLTAQQESGGCKVALAPGGSQTASDQGTLRFTLDTCALK